LRHYVLVSQDERLVEVYSRDGLRWAYEDARDRGAIALEAIGAPLDVAELYAGILPTAARSGGARPSRGRPHG
jgi:hypothetical protein